MTVPSRPVGASRVSRNGSEEAVMAAARDQAARVVRQEPEAVRQAPETAEGEAARDTAQLADQLRTHVAEETRRRPADTPGVAPTDRPAAPPADAARDAAK